MPPCSASRRTWPASIAGGALVLSVVAPAQLRAHPQGKEGVVEHPTVYRTTRIDGLSIFYRESGPQTAPTLLLLHGLPSSSRMFEPLFSRLSDHHHLVWGKHDLSFDPGEPERYRKDVPGAEVHVLDAGHFALDTRADEIAALVRDFAKTQK